MIRRALVSTWNRRAWRSTAASKSSASDGAVSVLAAASVGVVVVAAGVELLSTRENDDSPTLLPHNTNITYCQNDDDAGIIQVSNEISEEERFEQCVAYHRCFLADYRDRWSYKPGKVQTTPTTSIWPLYVPQEEEVPSIEYDITFCKRTDVTESHDCYTYCCDLQFRLASFYLRQDAETQKKGLKMMKRLAEEGHGDGMCMYGVVLNEGKLVETNSKQATVWWRRAVDRFRHVQSTYELAVAFYTGEGVPESEELAVYYFEKAATLGHAGAAYMLGDCLLDGVGAPRDRAEALEWLVAAGELGHRGARSRVLAVLENDIGVHHGRFTDKSRQTLVDDVEDVEEGSKWSIEEGEHGGEGTDVSIERRFTIGGGSGNPVVLARRKTVVAESRTP